MNENSARSPKIPFGSVDFKNMAHRRMTGNEREAEPVTVKLQKSTAVARGHHTLDEAAVSRDYTGQLDDSSDSPPHTHTHTHTRTHTAHTLTHTRIYSTHTHTHTHTHTYTRAVHSGLTQHLLSHWFLRTMPFWIRWRAARRGFLQTILGHCTSPSIMQACRPCRAG